MKRKKIATIISFCILSLTLLISSPASADRGIRITKTKSNAELETVLYNNSYALIIGVSDYSENWPDLPGVEGDIQAVKKIMENRGFQVVVVKNPNRNQLDKSFSDFINTYGQDPDSLLVFYFAGHGHTLTLAYGGEMGYVVPADAPNPNFDKSGFLAKAMDMQQIEVFAKRIQSKHALFLFDSCFSGSIFSVSRAAPESITYKTGKPVRQFITSGGADEAVPDKSIFRDQFIGGLQGEADVNNDGYVTGSELGEFLQNKVVNYSKGAQHPQYGKIRDPNLDKGDVVFVLPGARFVKNIQTTTESSPLSLDPEKEMWELVKNSSNSNDVKAFLNAFPQGQLIKVAQLKLKQIENRQSHKNDAPVVGPGKVSYGITFSLQSYKNPALYVRHMNYFADVTEVNSDSGRRDSTFKLLPGLADNQNVSFESLNYPNHYLRHEFARLRLREYSDNSLFKQDATFKVVQGLANENWLSFESLNNPGYYIRSKNDQLFIDKRSSGNFAAESTFKLSSPNWPPLDNDKTSTTTKKSTQQQNPIVSGIWRHDYIEGGKNLYLRLLLTEDGQGFGEGEESDGTWWAAPLTWRQKENQIELVYPDNTESFKLIKLANDTMHVIRKGETGLITFSRIQQKSLRQRVLKILPDQILGRWRDAWKEENGVEGFNEYFFQKEQKGTEKGKSATEEWQGNFRWDLNDGFLQIQHEDGEKDSFAVVGFSKTHMDFITNRGKDQGTGFRVRRIPTRSSGSQR